MKIDLRKVNNQKYFIDYTNEVRECSACREVKPFSQMKPRYDGSGRVRSRCKDCGKVESRFYKRKRGRRNE